MPNWIDVQREITEKFNRGEGLDYDSIVHGYRRKYLEELSRHTRRNVISYYSPTLPITESDMNAFMAVVYGLDRRQGLDLILHTLGGDVAATEALVNYLRAMFGIDIRAIIPQLAMSAGTMIACACKVILMGKHSSLGPIDPQIGGMLPAKGILEEFEEAAKEISHDPSRLDVWRLIIEQYNPTLLGNCKRAINLAEEIVTQWLRSGMFAGERKAKKKSGNIVASLLDLDRNKIHSRHLPLASCMELGLKITRLEEDDTLQDLVLTVHHAYMLAFENTNAIKIVENHNGKALITYRGS